MVVNAASDQFIHPGVDECWKYLVNDIREEIVASYILFHSKSRIAVISQNIIEHSTHVADK